MNFGFEPRDYQLAAVEYGKAFFAKASRGSRDVLAGPTGCGKSIVELMLQDAMGEHYWIVTPRLEIAAGILRKKGLVLETMQELIEAAFAHRVVTPVRFRNALMRGDIQRVDGIVFDEGHHVTANTWEQLQLLCGMPPAILLTATPYRGTAKGTAKFLTEWGKEQWMVTLREAASRKDIAIPCCEILPLVDDDVVELAANGDFDVKGIVSEYKSRIEDLADASSKWVTSTGAWDRPTVFSLPSVDLAKSLAASLCRRNAPCVVVHAGTKRSERDACYRLLVECHASLAQVAVLGEGVDLPVRRLVDASPCMSPVKWMQQIGRAMRPVRDGEAPPCYVCTNRNLSRHAYLFEGLLPPSVVALSDGLFGKPSKRAGHRALGLEAIGRFRAAEVKLLDGNTLLFYSLVSLTDGRVREFACMVHPCSPDALWAERKHRVKADGTKDWGKWSRCIPPEDLVGFGSSPNSDPTDKQKAWWERSAKGRGLDPAMKVTRKNFAALPFMFDLGISFGKGARR